MPSESTLITFGLYFLILLGIGFYFYRKSKNIEDYLLGGRGLGSWVTALSAQASDMSGWLLMGLPGAVFLSGPKEAWIAVGLFIGTCFNWKLIAKRLRVYTEKTNAITLPSFFESRFQDPSGLLRVVSAIIILIFFTIYVSSGLVAAGKLFDSMFDKITYHQAILIGGAIIVVYTFLGGFLAVCWTDLFQGLLMFVAILIIPIAAYCKVGGIQEINLAMEAKNISSSLIPRNGQIPILAILSAMAWGLGYFGQPHILARFMGIKSIDKLPRSMTIAIIWVLISLTGAVLADLIGIAMFDKLDDKETVLIHMIGELFPWIGGILLAAILSAIMSTIDSQLLVCSSALTKDFYQKAIKKDASEKELIWIGRFCVILIFAIAFVLALNPESSILDIVAYAWGGFGAAFGPVVLFALFSRKTTWKSALAGMITGAGVLVLWKQVGLSEHMYEIVPGFIANCLAILIINQIDPQKNIHVLQEFQDTITSE
jgi:sodium/proline symporter